MQQQKERNAFLLEAGKLIVTTIIATAGASWTARGILADIDHRTTIVETQQQNTERYVTAAIGDIRTDVRDLRQAVLGDHRP